MQRCPPRAQLNLVLADELGNAERQAVEAHVESCRACQEVLAQLAAEASRLGASSRPRPVHKPDPRFIDQLKQMIPSTPSVGGATAPACNGAPAPSEDSSVLAGEEQPSVPGYEVLGELGRGGMGIVYKARHRALNRLVALKMILAAGHADPEQRARFHKEAEALARLQHPHIVQIHEVGEQRGRLFLALELVEGPSLAQRLRGTPLPVRQAAELLETLSRAVQYAHTQGVLHRDLKPGNILLQNPKSEIQNPNEDRPVPRDGGTGAVPVSDFGFRISDLSPKVTDFGLAKWLGAASSDTASGAVLGTPSYMPPEQAAGSKETGPAADVYSLGAILYECLTGRPPFQAETPLETLRQVREEEPVPPSRLQPRVPRDLETICLECLQKEPARRYSSALALADDLRRFLDGRPIQARPVGPAERLWRWCRRNPWVAGLAAMVVVTLLAGTGISLYFAVQAEARSRDYLAQFDRAEAEAQRARESANQAIAARDRARHHLYVTRMYPVPQLWMEGKVGRVLELLEEQRPGPQESDLRGWEWHYQWRLSHGALQTLTAHKGWDHVEGVLALAFSPDGRWLASAGGERSNPAELFLWEHATGRLARSLTGHTDEVHCLAFSPDGRTLASGGWDHTVRLWDVADGRLLHTLKGHEHSVDAVTFSPDGRRLASLDNVIWGSVGGGGYGGPPDPADRKRPVSHGTVKLWEVTDGRSLRTWETFVASLLAFLPEGQLLALPREAQPRIESRSRILLESDDNKLQLPAGIGGDPAAISPDGRTLAVGGKDGVRLWDLLRGQGPRPLKGHAEQGTHGLAFSPDGRWLASAGEDGTVRTWDFADNDRVRIFRGHDGTVRCVAFSPDGLRLASSGNDGTIRTWDPAATGVEMRPFVGAKEARQVAFTPDGTQLVVLGAGVLPEVWDTVSCRKLPGPRGGTAPLAASPDGRWLASACPEGIRLWDTTTWREVRTIRNTQTFTRLAFGPGGKLASATNSSLQLWDAATGKELLTLTGHGPLIVGLAFSPNGQRVAATSGEAYKRGKIDVWDSVTGQKVLTAEAPVVSVTAVAWSADGRLLAVAGTDAQPGMGLHGPWAVKLCDAATGQQVRAIPWASGQLLAVAFSPDGRLLAGSGDGAARAWEVDGGKEVFAFKARTGQSQAVVFSPDSRRLAVANLDEAIRIWEVAAGREHLSLAGTANGLAFSADGRRLLAGGRTIQVWDATSGEELHSLAGPAAGLSTMALSPDGRRVALAGWDCAIRIWNREGWQPFQTLRGHTTPVRLLAFRADGRLLASADGDLHRKKPGEVRIWDAETGREIGCLAGHSTLVTSIAFQPNGQLVSVNGDGTLKVWNTTEGREVRTDRLPLKNSVQAVPGPDGRLLACTGGEDTRVLLWDLNEGREVRALAGNKGEGVYRAIFSPDGQRVLSSSTRGLQLWDVATGQELCTMSSPVPSASGLAFSPDGSRIAVGGFGLGLLDARPLTPELAVEREALGLLDALFGRPLPAREALDIIRTSPGLSEPVRQKALALADHYREEDNPERYAAAARRVARQSNLPASWYRQALAQARMACSVPPVRGPYLTALGMAQYRTGDHREARSTLARAEGLNARERTGPIPADLALLALSCSSLGLQDEAKAHLARLRERAKMAPWDADLETASLLREAEMRIDGKPAP